MRALAVILQDSVLQYYLSLGAPRSKLIVGIPFYGQSFSTSSTPRNYREDTAGPGKPGIWTKQRGMLAYYEICSKGQSYHRQQKYSANNCNFLIQ